jgi:putative transposase
MIESKIYYRRRLPHYQPFGATFHVVFRLAGSLPREVIERMRSERETEEKRISGIIDKKLKQIENLEHRRRYFEKFDALLDGSGIGPRWLAEPSIAGIVAEAIRYRDRKAYDLLAFSIMPNHVHKICIVRRPDWSPYDHSSFNKRRPSSPYILTRILENLKWYTALKCNQQLGRSAAFWQHESYDHVIRDDQELINTVEYVLNNPVKAGLVPSWELWPWTYCKPGTP